MSLDKAIKSGKEHRKGYAERGKPGRHDPTRRPHGGGYRYPCAYCERNRLFAWRKLEAEADEQIGGVMAPEFEGQDQFRDDASGKRPDC